MKKYKWQLIISLMAALVIIVSCRTHFDTMRAGYSASPSPQALERGRVMVYSTCAGCHYDRTVNKFIGTRILDVPGIAGNVYSANLTRSISHGIPPHYTDAELKYLLKTGVSKEGRFIPYMLRPNMSDEDINAIIVYLRSDDPAVAAADTTVGITHYNLFGKFYMNSHAKPLPYKPGIKTPPENEPVALGRYLVDNLGCFHCHSKSPAKLNYINPELSEGYLDGGATLKGEQGKEIIASNITPDKQTGIGDYTKEKFLKALIYGEAPDRKLRPPMPRFQKLSDSEVNAIYAYLQTIPAKYHKIGYHR
jgi:mono/diheme cytochrome c family protein